MREKLLRNYYIQVMRLFIDVVKLNGMPKIKVVDCESGYRVIFNMQLELISTNINDVNYYNYVYNVVKRNLDLLVDRAQELGYV